MRSLIFNIIIYAILWFTGLFKILWNQMIACWEAGHTWTPSYALAIVFAFLLLLPLLVTFFEWAKKHQRPK